MKTIFVSVALSIFVLSPALADPGNGNGNGGGGNGNGNGNQSHTVGAPVPLLGAGLPGLGIAVGYGAYWLARRRRNKEAG
jgi:hypothetical protein